MLSAADRLANTELGKRIAGLRAARGMSLDALAAALGISKTMMHKYERGAAIIPAVILKRIADALGVSIGELFGDGQGALPFTPAIGRLVHALDALGQEDGLLPGAVIAVAHAHVEAIRRVRRIRKAKA